MEVQNFFSSAHKSLCLGDFNLKGWTFISSCRSLSLLCIFFSFWDEGIRSRTERKLLYYGWNIRANIRKSGMEVATTFFCSFFSISLSLCFFLSLNTKFHACKTWISAKKRVNWKEKWKVFVFSGLLGDFWGKDLRKNLVSGRKGCWNSLQVMSINSWKFGHPTLHFL
jgi:hypothetical protein